MSEVICANHKCRARFDTGWSQHLYCCEACRKQSRGFRKSYGEQIINTVMDGRDPSPLIEYIVGILSADR